MTLPLSLYLHVPFCAQKCRYCAFYSIAGKRALVSPYVKAVRREIGAAARRAGNYEVETVYLGGGTPSLLPVAAVAGIMQDIRRGFRLSQDAEVTLEANPESVTGAALRGYRKAGINRLSLGLQAWQDHLLREMGRAHDRAAFVRAMAAGREAGLENINVDLIFGLPGQTLAEWEESLREVTALRPAHVACYSLELDNRSAWGVLHSHHRLRPVDEAADREMYHRAGRTLAASGYHHYEISNWALPGYACRHNFNFWRGLPYMGLGAGAASWFEGKSYRHPDDLPVYLKDPVATVTEPGTVNDKAAWLMLRLRLVEGFAPEEYRQKFGTDITADYGKALKVLTAGRLVVLTDDRLRLTRKGLDLADAVVTEMVYSQDQ